LDAHQEGVDGHSQNDGHRGADDEWGEKEALNAVDDEESEPALANDAARSLNAGHIIRNEAEPQTIADGARTLSLGEHNWPILRDGIAGIVEVPEDKIAESVRLLFELANLKAEPTGALSVAAVLTDPDKFRGRAVCCVVSGGNVDPIVFRNILGG